MVKRNNSNNEREVNNSSNKRSNPIRKLGYGLAIFLGLLGDPENVDAQHYKNDVKEQTEQVIDYDMLSHIEQMTGVKLPAEYEKKVRDFINYSDIFKDEDVRKYTENFIIEEMERDWGYDIDKIDKQVLIRSGITMYVMNEDIYDGTDGDEKRLDAFVNTVDKVDDCGNRFKRGLIERMKTISLEAVLQSEEYKQQSAEAKQDVINSASNTLKQIIRFYKLYKKNPDIVKTEEIDVVKKVTKDTIELCNRYGVDYTTILLNELGDKKIVNEILRFYEIE